MQAHPRGEGQSVDDWLRTPEQQRRNKYGLPGALAVCCGTPAVTENVDLAQPVPLRSWPATLVPNVVAQPESTHIEAPPQVVWDVITDYAHYGDWNPFHRKVEVLETASGDVVLQLHVRLMGYMMKAVERVFYVDEQRFIIAYGRDGHTPSWRTQWLEERPDGSTTYHSYDAIGGHLAPVVGLCCLGSVERDFNNQHDALKTYCENLPKAKIALPKVNNKAADNLPSASTMPNIAAPPVQMQF